MLCVLALCLGLLPVTALAGEQVSYIQRSWDSSTNTVTQEEKSVTEYTVIYSTTTSWDSSTTGGWYVAQGNVTISQRVTVTGDVHLILTDGCTLTIDGGIQVQSKPYDPDRDEYPPERPNNLTIYGQSENNGTLSATSTGNNAAIGGNGGTPSSDDKHNLKTDGGTGGTVTIHGGTITATCTGSDAEVGGAGIGGGGASNETVGRGGTGCSVTIYGGTVNATGGTGTKSVGGTGIGHGGCSRGTPQAPGPSDITIYGGTVNVTGGDLAPGMDAAGGNGGSGISGAVSIHSGMVTATGGNGGSGIRGTVSISGGTVTATGTGEGSGIVDGTTTISGGTVIATGTGDGSGIGNGTTTISGGTVNATGSGKGLGIEGDVTISGGTVTAIGGSKGAGIGGRGIDDGGHGSYGRFSTGEDGSAVIFASSFSFVNDGDNNRLNWQGVIFEGNQGQVYGRAVLSADKKLMIASGKTLTIPKDAELINNGTMTNNGIVNNSGTVTNNGTMTNNGTWTNKVNGITLSPESVPNLAVPDSETLTATVTWGTVSRTSVSNATDEPATLSWESSNETFATVTGGTVTTPGGTVTVEGTVKAVSEGTATITVAAPAQDDPFQDICIVNVIQPVTGVTLDKGNLSLTVRETGSLTATVLPDNATNKNVTWTSSDTGVARVDSSGTVTAVGPGTATITATAQDGSGQCASCTVTVTQPVTGVTLDKDTLSLTVGTTATLQATVTPTNASNQAISWSSSNETVATVENGRVTAHQAGQATITVTTQDGSFSDTCAVTVTTVPVTGVTLDKTNLSLTVGGTEALTATVHPDNATNKNIAWTSSNNSVATVDSTGTVTAVSAGTATITATAADGGYEATCTVTVTRSGGGTPTYSVSLPGKVEGGTVTANKRYAVEGETFRFTVTPDEGWELNTLTVTDSKGKEIDLTHKGGNEYTFKMPAGRVEIEVSFREIEVELPFTDVPEGAWYADAAAYVYEHGLMAGTSATTFAPDATTSRSMIATILWRMAGSPAVNYAMNYTDVAQGQWYTEAIRWAASEGIVSGYGDSFGTDDPITREQLATMLWRYAQTEGYDVSIGEDTNILSYTDVADLSEYAIPAMQWAVGAGIITGTGDGSTLTPQGQATRAQAAVMLMRFCEEYVVW